MSSDANKNLLYNDRVSISDLVENRISPETLQVLKEQDHKNEQERLENQHKRDEDREHSKHRRKIEISLCAFGALCLTAIGLFSLSIILNPKSPNELTKWACGVLGTFAGASVGLIRRP